MAKLRAGSPPLIPSAGAWNRHEEVADWYHRNKALGEGGGGLRFLVPTDIVEARNDSGADRRLGEVLELDLTAILDEIDPEYPWFKGVAPNTDRVFGILRRPVQAGQIAELQIAGQCQALVNVTNADHRAAYIATGSHVLQSFGTGPVRIISKPAGTGELECTVRLFEEPRIEIVKKTSNVKDGTSGYFPAKLMRFDPLTKSLTEVADIWLADLNDL